MESDERTVLKLELTRAQYLALEKLAKKQGYPLVTDFLRALVAEIASGGSERELPRTDIGDLIETLAKRLERRIEDILNPFTAKIDEVNRRLSQILELLEALQEQQAEASAREKLEKPAPRAERVERVSRQRRPSAMEKLKEQKVVFYSDVAWMKAPEKLFEKLSREGALVFEAYGELVGVDPEFWSEFTRLLAELSISDPDKVGTLLSAKLGEQARRLFEKLKKAGLAYYDRDRGVWVVSVGAGSQRGPTSG